MSLFSGKTVTALLVILFLALLSQIFSIGIDRTGLKCAGGHRWVSDGNVHLLYQVSVVQIYARQIDYQCEQPYDPKKIKNVVLPV